MYPFKAQLSTTLVRNEWYVVATSSELGEEPVARTILGRPVAIFRDGEGKAVMLHGLCPHRNYPLGDGESQVVDGQIQCGYHGIRFDGTGTCTFVPGAPKPSRFLSVTAYPVVEQAGWVWAWTGDPELADPSKLPALDRPELYDPSWDHRLDCYYEVVKGRYMLLLENLMDLSHLSYLHGDVVQDVSIADRRLDVEEDEHSLRAIRRMDNAPIGFMEATLYKAEPGSGTYYYDNQSEYFSPSLIVTGNRLPDGSPEGFGSNFFIHAVTPETENTTHYWVQESRDFRVGDRELDEFFIAANQIIPVQDKAALEFIESTPESAKWAERAQHFDRAALRMRAKIEERLVEEQAVSATAADQAPATV
jgi:vanillate O-demethylase monooxygenase subunit